MTDLIPSLCTDLLSAVLTITWAFTVVGCFNRVFTGFWSCCPFGAGRDLARILREIQRERTPPRRPA